MLFPRKFMSSLFFPLLHCCIVCRWGKCAIYFYFIFPALLTILSSPFTPPAPTRASFFLIVCLPLQTIKMNLTWMMKNITKGVREGPVPGDLNPGHHLYTAVCVSGFTQVKCWPRSTVCGTNYYSFKLWRFIKKEQKQRQADG